MNLVKTLALSGAFVSMAATANATLVDFTNPATFTTITNISASGAVDGVNYIITPDPAGQLTFAETATGTTCAASPLACIFDGLGVSDDEISANPPQSITIAFDQEVTLTNLYFLDLFIAANHSNTEQAFVSVDAGPALSYDAQEVFNGSNSGLGSFIVSLTGSSFTFFVNGNDNVGVGDFALAGIELAPIPLPAGLLLLGGALGALGVARRRKQVA